jgi:hypothetical protein
MDTDLAPPFGGTDPDFVRSAPVDTRASQQAGFAQFAVKAVDRQFGRLSGALNGVADSIEEFVDRPDSPVDETLKGYAASASEKLRSLAERTGDQDAAESWAASGAQQWIIPSRLRHWCGDRRGPRFRAGRFRAFRHSVAAGATG